MNTDVFNPLSVVKEAILKLNFPEEDVLTTAEAIKTRENAAKHSILKWDSYKNTVCIIFEDDETVKQVETTVWGVTDRDVILKGGIRLPLHRIHKIIELPPMLHISNMLFI